MRYSIAILMASVTMPAFAQDAAPVADAAPDAAEIVVFGRGQTRQVQEINSEDIVRLTPGASIIKAIEKLPSVNIQSADPFGNYEWSTRVTIRSFSQAQLGFNFDGIPLGDMSYGNHNGLHISRIVSSENVGSVRVTQGAGAVGSQATNNLGGTVETFSMEPLDHFAAQANATYGSDETIRGFVRLNVGSPDGFRGFVSYGYGSTDKYKGEGKQDQHMVNAKGVLPVGDGQIDGWFSYSDRREQDYQDMSLDMLKRLGYKWDNTYPDYARAIRYADIGTDVDVRSNSGGSLFPDGLYDRTGQPVLPGGGRTYPDNVTSLDDAYYDASGLRKDTVGALGYKTPIGDQANVAIKGYYHHNEGMGLWGTPYVPSPNGVPISIRTTEYDISRYGVFGSADFTVGFNKITVGGWYEHNKFNQARRFYALESRTNPGRDFRDFPKDPFFTQWNFDYFTDTLQYHVQDEIDLGQVKINLGWKGYRVKNRAEAIIKDVYPEGRFKTEDWFQPAVGAVFELNDSAELYASFSQATRAFPTVNGSIWGTTQAGFDAIKDTIKPETSDTYELGGRYNTPTFHGVLGAYLVNFHDRLLSVSSGPGIQGNPSILQNVGSVRSIGIEAAGDWQITPEISLFGSYTYTDATYRDDVFAPDDVVIGQTKLVAAIDGKTVVDTPKHMARGEVNYDNGALFARVGANFMSKRFFTYTNDLIAIDDGKGSVPGRVIVDATLGYRFALGGSDEKAFEIQFNASNLFDKQYIATINSNGYGNMGDNQTLLVGAPQQFFATIKAGF